MPKDYDARDGFPEPGGFNEPDDDDDDFDDDFDDGDAAREQARAGHTWPAPGYPSPWFTPGGYPPPPGFSPAPGALRPHASAGTGGPWVPPPPQGAWRRVQRGLLIAAVALVAAGTAFGIADVALGDVSGSPAAAATPSGGEPSSGTGNGTQLSPQGGGLPSSLPSGATLHLLVGGQVTAVSATSITLNHGTQAITATVTSATTVSGKVSSIAGVKVGDTVSESLSGTNGKLVATSIQDPASLPSGSGQ